METQESLKYFLPSAPMHAGRNLILATKPFAKEIRSKSWFHAISGLLLLTVMIAGSIFLPFVLLRIASSLAAGLLLVRIFIIYHDHQHHTILTKSPIADAIMTLFGMYILAPTSIWKRSHDHHHNNNSKLFSASIGSYPIATRKRYLDMSAKQRFVYLATRHPITIGLGYFSMFIFGMCIASFASNPRKHIDALLALIFHAVATVLLIIFFGWQVWFLALFLPLFISSALGAYLFYAQHNFPGVIFADNKNWAYEKAALESSSYIAMNPFLAWVTGNIGYHHIHHLNAKIPFYRLPEIMKHFPELQQCKKTSLKPRAIIACFRLKLWDHDKKKMIGLRDL